MSQKLFPSVCKQLALNFAATRLPGSANCSILNSRKLNFTCGSGTTSNCNASTNVNSAFYFIFAPYDPSGSFNDTAAGTINNCADMWSAVMGNPPSGNAVIPSDITAVYNSGASDTLTCTGAGCTFASSACFSGWDSSVGGATGNPVALPTGSKYFVCGFVDVFGWGLPPYSGYAEPALGSITSFAQITIAGAPNFTTGWADY